MSRSIALKCTYNDGGEGKYVGFSGPCSKPNIIRNIENGRIWCSNENCGCRQYYDSNFRNHDFEFYCYESQLFSDWSYGSGWYHNGEKAETPIKMKDTSEGKYAFFTTRFPEEDDESKRKIIGFFKISEIIDEEDEETFILGDNRYRMRFPYAVAQKMNFWDYYRSKNTQDVERWNTGLFRYMYNEQVLSIFNKLLTLFDNQDRQLIEEIIKKDFSRCQNVGDTTQSCLSSEKSKMAIATELLLKHRKQTDDPFYFPFLQDTDGVPVCPLDKKNANKFFLGCVLDMAMISEKAWENSRKLSEDILKDPVDLWGTICSYTPEEWDSSFKKFGIHRFKWRHNDIREIGECLIDNYKGDARVIWENATPVEVLDRLNEIPLGAQLSRMCIGALMDCGYLTGKSDVKADIHVKRVLGRVMNSRPLSEDQAIKLTRKMCPENPWLLDRPLYLIGKKCCLATDPNCEDCYMQDICSYRHTRGYLNKSMNEYA